MLGNSAKVNQGIDAGKTHASLALHSPESIDAKEGEHGRSQGDEEGGPHLGLDALRRGRRGYRI
jgi:hypothetical protein